MLQKKIKMKNYQLKFSEYMQNISRSKSFGKFVLIVLSLCSCPMSILLSQLPASYAKIMHNNNPNGTFAYEMAIVSAKIDALRLEN